MNGLPCTDVCEICGGTYVTQKIQSRDVRKCDECGNWHEVAEWRVIDGNILYHGDKFMALIHRGDAAYLAQYLNETETLKKTVESLKTQRDNCRVEIRKAIADWHRFQDFIIGEGPGEFFRLNDAGGNDLGVIEKFMKYLSSLWNELNDLRRIIAANKSEEPR